MKRSFINIGGGWWRTYRCPAPRFSMTSQQRQSSQKNRQSTHAESHFHISYETDWNEPFVHYAVNGGEWTYQSMKHHIVSAGSSWVHVKIPDSASSSEQQPGFLEFVITDGNGAWDKAPGDSNYLASTTGRYSLARGSLRLIKTPPVLIVSDLDDTLVGDDACTESFRAWWREVGVPAGGRLVYNTGRALESFERLMQEKAHCLGEPDVLISGVGTKIYRK